MKAETIQTPITTAAPSRIAAARQRKNIISKKLVVTLLHQRNKSTPPSAQIHIWDTSAPLPIGHPFKWIMEKHGDEILIRDITAPIGEIQKDGIKFFTVESAFSPVQISPQLSLTIRTPRNITAVNYPLVNVHAPELNLAKNITSMPTDPEAAHFKKALIQAGAALCLIAITSILWPASKTEESPEKIIPEQYTQIVMTKAKTPWKGEDKDAGGQGAGESTKSAAVVQAFRAKALQHSVQGLLKGGMTKLLGESDFLAGPGKITGQVFKAGKPGTGADVSNVIQAGMAGGRSVGVGGVGGGAGGAAGGIGYGSGHKAGVNGQGGGFVGINADGANVAEGLTKDEVGRVIHSHMSEIRYCYEASMVRSPNSEGKLLVEFVISGTGNVKTSAIKQSTLQDPGLDDCILRRLVRWKFPNPKGGVDVSVSYPFIFKSLGN